MTTKTKTTRTTKATAAKAVVVAAPPASPLTMSDYVADFKARVAIHNYEFGKAVEDMVTLGKLAHNTLDRAIVASQPAVKLAQAQLAKLN